MTGFDERRNAAEARYVHGEEVRFRARARRDKYLGSWAAERLGMTGQAALAYAIDVATGDYAGTGDEGLLRRVATDLEAGGVPVTAGELAGKLDGFRLQAEAEIGASAP